jgi:hypothetical protein
MNPIDAISLSTSLATSGLTQPALQTALPAPAREVSTASAAEFRERLAGPASTPATPATPAIELDIEKVLMANLPAANASPAEFAMGLLRAQVKVAQAAIAIELVNKTTQSLSQGVQSLATRS